MSGAGGDLAAKPAHLIYRRFITKKMKKTESKKPTVGTKKPFWDGRLRASTPGYRENYNSIFKQRRNFRRPSK